MALAAGCTGWLDLLPNSLHCCSKLLQLTVC